MRNSHITITVLFSVAVASVLYSCQRPASTTTTGHLTGNDSLSVVKEVIACTDSWAQANIERNADKAAEFWDSSSQMMFAENGLQYANWDSLHSVIKAWYAQPLDSVELRWEERNILPLSHSAAHLFGRLYFHAKFQSGDVYQSRAIETALLIKKDGTWRVIRGHESYKVLSSK